MTPAAPPARLLIVLAFAAIYLIWGSTFLAIAWAIDTIPPLLTMGIRFTVSGALLFGYGYRRSQGYWPSAGQWGWAAVAGFLMIFIDYGALSWAEQYVPSGVASVILATTPIWLVLLDGPQRAQLFRSPLLAAGILGGLLGVWLIYSGSRQAVPPTGLAATRYGLGMLALLLSALSWAVGTLVYRDRNGSINIPTRMGMQMLVGGGLLLVVSGLAGEWHSVRPDQITATSVYSLLYLIVFGTLVAHTAYLWLMQVQPPALVGTYAYVNPVVALLLGWGLDGEPLTALIGLATLIILGAVVLIKRAGPPTD